MPGFLCPARQHFSSAMPVMPNRCNNLRQHYKKQHRQQKQAVSGKDVAWSCRWTLHSSHIGLKDFDNKQHELGRQDEDGRCHQKVAATAAIPALQEGRSRAHSLITRALIINFSTAAQLEAVSLILLQVPKSIWPWQRPRPRPIPVPIPIPSVDYKVAS